MIFLEVDFFQSVRFQNMKKLGLYLVVVVKLDFENFTKELISTGKAVCSIFTGLDGGTATRGNILKNCGAIIHLAITGV